MSNVAVKGRKSACFILKLAIETTNFRLPNCLDITALETQQPKQKRSGCHETLSKFFAVAVSG
jgi:hypothetical protein